MRHLDYSVVIATYQRPAELAGTLHSLAAQTRLPAAVYVIDSSPDEQTKNVAEQARAPFPITYARARQPSAALQRNQGAELVATPLIAFLDDDVTLTANVFLQCVIPFEEDGARSIAGVAGRIEGQQHSPPRGLLWWYYRVQAGYRDADYSARLFGPAINTLPAYRETDGELIPAEWLNTTCVVYRREWFARERFPSFAGYSFMEDAHLAARMRRHGQLYFHKHALFSHHDAPSSFKRDVRSQARARFRNQRMIARDLLHLREPMLSMKLLLHRLFVTAAVLRARKPDRWKELAGVWT